MSRKKADEAKSTKLIKEDLTKKPVDTKKPQQEKKRRKLRYVYSHMYTKILLSSYHVETLFNLSFT